MQYMVAYELLISVAVNVAFSIDGAQFSIVQVSACCPETYANDGLQVVKLQMPTKLLNPVKADMATEHAKERVSSMYTTQPEFLETPPCLSLLILFKPSQR